MSTNPDEDRIILESPDSPFLTKDRILAWETGKTFSTDWATNHFFGWAELLHGLRDQPLRVLEIGSWEGRSALFFLNYLPRSGIVCVDPFAGNIEHQADENFAKLALKSEARFDANLADLRNRVEKIVGDAGKVLPELGVVGRRFDLAYIDGSHMAADVYRDAVLTWPLIGPGGIVIFDDYDWDLMNTESERPRVGIDAFLAAFAGQLHEIHRAYQIAIAKV